MTTYTYLIVGGGMAAAAAASAIRSTDAAGRIGIISAEADPPYDRPPLSKAAWKEPSLDGIWRSLPDGIEMHLGRTATGLDPDAREVVDDEGRRHGYERLLLATGGRPRQLPFAAPGVIYFRTVGDYRRLREVTASGGDVTVVGGGFIGSELAAAVAGAGSRCRMLLRGEGIGAGRFPADLVAFLNATYRERGVDVRTGIEVTSVEERDGAMELTACGAGGVERLRTGALAAGLGIEPDVDLARGAGLDVDDGIVVDAQLRTSRRDIWAAGDVARFYSPHLDSWIRVEHEDAANGTGAAAGRSMAGEDVTFRELPMFYSDLFDLGFEAVGVLDSRLEMVSDWHDPMRKGVVYYLEEGRVRGVLLWNVWDRVDDARRLIASPGPFSAAELKGKIG